MAVDEQSTTDPGRVVEEATAHVLALAQTWIAWDGRPRLAGPGGVSTPRTR